LRGGESCEGFGVLEEFEEMEVGEGESESIGICHLSVGFFEG
jgi:hypothetical protein